MHFLVAPQEFKGSLTASQAADAIAAGVRDAVAGAEIDLAPMSDGGPGLVDAMRSARGGELVESPARDPLMRQIRAAWARLPDGTAIIEMAAASGLVLLSQVERDPLVATTFGTGELVRAALELGCSEFVVGVGGSATVDGGAGALQALGARLLDAGGGELPPGGAPLARLAHVDLSRANRRLANVRLRVACDVANPLCGPQGAAFVFGPQKGASTDDVALLDAALRHFAECALRDTGIDFIDVPGGGAAGGLAAGLMLVGGRIEPGFAVVAEAAHLEDRVRAADVVITGEGRLDSQTAFGKTADGVSKMARSNNKPVAVIAGTISADYDRATTAFDVVEQAAASNMDTKTAMLNGRALVRAAAARAVWKLATSGTGGRLGS